ncbi:copper homeostasis periplasmic binding protein CopC [Rhizobium leguminosarum]|uniref:copper homeostasis periplasmic binding protein CopC n=1 Tax=Rhizobium leguminosarum TaxID=384 RepID=UPI001C94F527|nr:copper homeostasis periplasmic binding protein CopC [Rhizobium leguminosarum]MBY5357677.1 copper homeostasis periplasmic binding protein CopC [Rhizobium leguminosarum]
MPQIKKLTFLAAGASIALASQVFAHAHLKSAAPASDSTVKQAPSELDLTFTEGLNLKFSGVKVTAPDKAVVKTGGGSLMDGDMTLMVPVSQKLTPGKYTVEWHVLSTDGHKTNGTYSFTVAP